MQYVLIRPGTPRIRCSSVLAHVHHSGLYRGNYMSTLRCVVRLWALQHSLCRCVFGIGGFRQHQVHQLTRYPLVLTILPALPYMV